MTLKQEKDAGTNIVSLCQSRNVIFKFQKPYLQTPFKILHFPTPGRIQKCLTKIQNILAFLTVNHVQSLAHNKECCYVIPVCIIVQWWNVYSKVTGHYCLSF